MFNTEHSSSGVRKYDHAYSDEMLYRKIGGLSRQGREVFRADWTKRQKKF